MSPSGPYLQLPDGSLQAVRGLAFHPAGKVVILSGDGPPALRGDETAADEAADAPAEVATSAPHYGPGGEYLGRRVTVSRSRFLPHADPAAPRLSLNDAEREALDVLTETVLQLGRAAAPILAHQLQTLLERALARLTGAGRG
jgi:hypothetical protein